MWLKLFGIFCVSVLPISLIKFNIISKKFRLIVLAFLFAAVSGIIYFRGISLHELGLRTDNLFPAVLVYLFSTIIAILFLFSLSKIFKTKQAERWHEDPHFLFLFIPISFAQQFLFFAFILSELRSFLSIGLAILINALIFGYMHTIYPKPLFSFILGTLAGIFFGTLYTLYPNLILASITHAILNFTAVYLAFFTFTEESGHPKKTELGWKFDRINKF